MYHVVYLLLFFLFCKNEKVFVSERIIIIFKAFLQNLQYSVELLKK